MTVGALGSTAPSFAASVSSPTVELLQAQQSADSALFGGASGTPGDLESLTATVAAYPMTEDPALLTEVQQWDGSETPGSERATSDPYAAAAPITPTYSFNPFDTSTWGTQSVGTNLDVSA